MFMICTELPFWAKRRISKENISIGEKALLAFVLSTLKPGSQIPALIIFSTQTVSRFDNADFSHPARHNLWLCSVRPTAVGINFVEVASARRKSSNKFGFCSLTHNIVETSPSAQLSPLTALRALEP